MDIPDAISVLMVLANLAHAVFTFRLPNIGALSPMFAKSCSPNGVFLKNLTPNTIAATMIMSSHHLYMTKSAAAIIIRVASGS